MSPVTSRGDAARRFSSLNGANVDRDATEFVHRYGPLIMRDAIRFSTTNEDAEDAYQRSLEILLTKGSEVEAGDLVPWLRVVVRREAMHIAQARERSESALDPEVYETIESESRSPEESAEAMAKVDMGFEALGRLSEDQVRCLLAQAEGFEYDEIAEITGFTKRKVSRCLERGRERFACRLDSIATGSECERMRPLIHRVLNADADAAVELRPHLRHCGVCRGLMRDYQSAPREIAALLPPALVFTQPEGIGLFDRIAEIWSSFAERVMALAPSSPERWTELATAKKLAAVAAVATATAGGGAAVHQAAGDRPARESDRATASQSTPRAPRSPMYDAIDLPPEPKPRRKKRQAPREQPARQQVAAPAPSASSGPAAIDDGSAEFAPEGGPAE